MHEVAFITVSSNVTLLSREVTEERRRCASSAAKSHASVAFCDPDRLIDLAQLLLSLLLNLLLVLLVHFLGLYTLLDRPLLLRDEAIFE